MLYQVLHHLGFLAQTEPQFAHHVKAHNTEQGVLSTTMLTLDGLGNQICQRLARLQGVQLPTLSDRMGPVFVVAGHERQVHVVKVPEVHKL